MIHFCFEVSLGVRRRFGLMVDLRGDQQTVRHGKSIERRTTWYRRTELQGVAMVRF